MFLLQSVLTIQITEESKTFEHFQFLCRNPCFFYKPVYKLRTYVNNVSYNILDKCCTLYSFQRLVEVNNYNENICTAYVSYCILALMSNDTDCVQKTLLIGQKRRDCYTWKEYNAWKWGVYIHILREAWDPNNACGHFGRIAPPSQTHGLVYTQWFSLSSGRDSGPRRDTGTVKHSHWSI